mgnify:FL=1
MKEISERTRIPLAALCLNYVINNRSIDKVVIGVDSLTNISELVSFTNMKLPKELIDYLDNLSVDDESILLPMNWK